MRDISYEDFGALPVAEFGDWLNGLDHSSNWQAVNRVKTTRGAFIVRVEPVLVDGKPVTFADREAPG